MLEKAIHSYCFQFVGMVSLTLCILMDFPIQIKAIIMGLSIIDFKGVTDQHFSMMAVSVPEDCFCLNKQCRT